jgi:ankyrin repeat protein
MTSLPSALMFASNAQRSMSGGGKRRARALRDAAGDNDPHGIDAALAGVAEYELDKLLNSRDFVGKTALHWAAGRGRVEAVRHLLQLGAKVKTADNQCTPLHTLAESGALGAHVLVAELVTAAPWILKHSDMMHNTALDRAKYVKNKDMIQALLAMYGAEGGVANDTESGSAAGPKKRGYFSTLLFGKSKEQEASEGFSLLRKIQEPAVQV